MKEKNKDVNWETLDKPYEEEPRYTIKTGRGISSSSTNQEESTTTKYMAGIDPIKEDQKPLNVVYGSSGAVETVDGYAEKMKEHAKQWTPPQPIAELRVGTLSYSGNSVYIGNGMWEQVNHNIGADNNITEKLSPEVMDAIDAIAAKYKPFSEQIVDVETKPKAKKPIIWGIPPAKKTASRRGSPSFSDLYPPMPKVVEKTPDKSPINKDEEAILNVEELADELANMELKLNPDLKYEDLLEKYKKIILKHERNNKD